MDVPRAIGGVASIRAAFLAACGLFVLPQAAPAQAREEVDLELVLAVDVSRSMDPDEQQIQREGYIGAFLDREVIGAIRSGVLGRIAVAYVEWAGAASQQIVVPWTVVSDAASAAAFSARLASAPIEGHRRTSISNALTFSAALIENSGFSGTRQVIDISGDGPNNQGPGVEAARDAVLERGIVINGLPVVLKYGTPAGFFEIPDLDAYYEDCVIGGFGAFIVSVRSADEFASAIRRKMVMEIAGATPALRPAQMMQRESPTDCYVGEKRWNQYMWDPQ